jgi:integrase
VAKRKRSREVVKLNAWVTKLWLPVVRSQLKESTFDSYSRNMHSHVLPRIGHLPLDKITPRMLTGLYVDLLQRGRLNAGEQGLSAKTVRYIHTIVHKALADAVADGLIEANPAERARPPRPDRQTSSEIRFWEPHHLAQFMRHVAGSRLEPLWHLAAFTGMRRGELLGLRWCDIDIERRRLSIRRSVVSVAYRVVETTPKSHQARVVDLDDATLAILEVHRQREVVAGRGDPEQRVFHADDGALLHPNAVTVRFRAAVQAAQVPRIRFHDLRHTHATLALLAGVAPKVISERLGHRTPEFTMHQYAHLLPGMQAEAATRIAELVSNVQIDGVDPTRQGSTKASGDNPGTGAGAAFSEG